MSNAVQRAKQVFVQHKSKLTHQFGLVSQLSDSNVPELPEFLMLGSSNVGKSSLLARLLDPSLKNAVKTTNITKKPAPGRPDLPRVSKRAGFTTTISVYTLPKRLNVLDSPGYGFKSRVLQGDVVQKYLELRGGLCKQAYILTHAKRGVSDDDRAVCGMLAQFGVPFSFVITKADLLGKFYDTSYEDVLLNPVFDHIKEDALEVCRSLAVPQPLRTLVTSTKQGYGIDQLRGDILLLSGLIGCKM